MPRDSSLWKYSILLEILDKSSRQTIQRAHCQTRLQAGTSWMYAGATEVPVDIR